MGLTHSALNLGNIPFFTYTSKRGFKNFADEEHQSITFFP